MDGAAGLLLFCLVLQLATCGLCRRPLIRAPRDAPTTGRYTVVLKRELTKEECSQAISSVSKMARVYGHTEKLLATLTVDVSPYALESVRHMEAVDYVEEEGIARGAQDESLLWYLDRLDQQSLPLDYHYNPIGDGEGVDVYILDSGIKYSHEEFENRAKYSGYDAVDAYESMYDESFTAPGYGEDCHGHGTHVASLCGGKTFGVAKKVNLYSHRVLRCDNSAPWSVVLDGVDKVKELIARRKRPAIISMSLGGSRHRVLNEMIQRLYDIGYHIIVAAGNDKTDACRKSPASSPHVTTVGGTRDGDGIYDHGSGTNYGQCVDIFAPAQTIKAADIACANCSVTFSGTSMSTPLVSGVAAIFLSRQPLLKPDELKEKLLDASAKDKINFTEIPAELRRVTPNKLLQVPGSCGGRVFRKSEGVISSPNYPSDYPENLHCVWTIGGELEQQIEFNLTALGLEPSYDTLTIYDGECCNEASVLTTLTGYLHKAAVSFRSTGTTLSIMLKTDGTVGMKGFTGKYIKFYRDTRIKVPERSLNPSPCCEVEPVPFFLVLLNIRARPLQEELQHYVDQGFKVSWLSAYRAAPGSRRILHFGVIPNNGTKQDTVAFSHLRGPEELQSKIEQMRRAGYSVKHISDRTRSTRQTCLYYAVFERANYLVDTEVFMRDSIATHMQRLATKTAAGYILKSLSLCDLTHVGGIVEVTSVYTRDKRVAAGISIEQPRWASYFNLTFFEFSNLAIDYGNQSMYPTYVESYELGSYKDSYFSVVFREFDVSLSRWFRWGINQTEVEDIVASSSHSWAPVIVTGYNLYDRVFFFVEFARISQFLSDSSLL